MMTFSPRYLESTAPRYTSYPPATQFSGAVTPEVVRGWLGALPAQTAISVYLHIPYCKSICWYCGCHTVASQRDGPPVEYAFRLQQEIALAAAASSAKTVRQIHWGGGTPNALPPDTFVMLMAELARRFDLSGLTEHAIEVDPRTLSQAHAEVYAAAGANRASLGVQDLNEHVQRAIGRVQPLEQVARAVSLLREAGVSAVNLDLMFGLPDQSLADAAVTAEQALTLSPDRLAVFGYAHVPWFKARQRLIDEAALPGAQARLDQAAAMRAAILAAGYVEIGFDHYARPQDPLARASAAGALKRNFQGYVADEADALLGFGASAISTYPQGYAQNIADIATWGRAVGEASLPVARGFAVNDDDRRRRAIIERILCDFAVDLAAFGGWRGLEDAEPDLTSLAADGLVTVEGERVSIPLEAQPFARLVAQAFDGYRENRQSRHSRAV